MYQMTKGFSFIEPFENRRIVSSCEVKILKPTVGLKFKAKIFFTYFLYFDFLLNFLFRFPFHTVFRSILFSVSR